MSPTAARFGGREGVRGAGDDGGHGQGQLGSGLRPGRVLGAAHREGQRAHRGQDVPRREPHEGELNSISHTLLSKKTWPNVASVGF